MRRTILSAATVVFILAFAAPPSLAQATTSPGKNAAFAFSGLLTVAPGEIETLRAIIAKGRKNRVLTVIASLTYAGASGPGGQPILWAEVNGVPMIGGDGPPFYWNVFETASGTHSGSVSWWLDLDQAEADSPGTFKKQPLEVEVSIANETFASRSLNTFVTMSVRMEKK